MKFIWLSLLVVAPVLSAAQVPPAWRPFMKIKPDDSRVRVVKALAKDMNPYSRKLVVAALADPNAAVVAAAADALRDDHCSETFQALVAGMPNGSQYEAALLLGTYKETRYVKAMGKLLRHERIEVRRPVALALGLSQSSLAMTYLESDVNDPDPNVRDEVSRALGRFGAKAVVPRD